MDIKDLIPRRGDDTYRLGDSDDLVVMENIGTVPSGAVCLQNHGVIFFITEGIGREYHRNDTEKTKKVWKKLRFRGRKKPKVHLFWVFAPLKTKIIKDLFFYLDI